MKVYTFTYFRKYILIIAKMKNLNFSFDIFSYSKEKKKEDFAVITSLFSTNQRRPSLAALATKRRTSRDRTNFCPPPSLETL